MDREQEDLLLRQLLESTAIDFSKLDNDPPYPLIWDEDFNFIGHKAMKERLNAG